MPAPQLAQEAGPLTIVCDNGTGYVKCGFAGDTVPHSFPCMVGTPLQQSGSSSRDAEVVVGTACADSRHMLDISYPVSNGQVQDWDAMERVWDHTFEHVLNLDAAARARTNILLTEPPLNPLSNRERMVDTMFRKYGFAGVQVQIQAVLTLYSQGKMTGLVIDIGDGVTHIIPVIEGCSFPHLTRRLNIAGRDITSRLVDLLQRRGYCFNAAADFETVRSIKERACYVAADYQRELQLARETTCLVQSYGLPDGRTVKVGGERMMAPEVLFRPSLMDVEAPGVAEQVFQCIQDMDMDNRLPLYQNIMLSGGTTMLPGLATRLERDIRHLYLKHILKGREEGLQKLKLRVLSTPHRKHVVFSGASVLADIMSSSSDFWIGRDEWAQNPQQALKKCMHL
ncbi:g8484 [Coccomyxa viridis]|uniref:G8484 protein n=1 Tax=Coccomyxa viridis TaxID=1274662 RepID=A0ABP1G2V2_9CHLO